MKLSLFTVSFAGFWGQQKLTLEESIDKAAELGFEGVELMGKRPHFSPLDYSIDDCKRLRERIEKNGLVCSAVAAYNNFTDGNAAEVPLLEMQIDYITQLAERASLLGSNLVRIFTSYEREDMPWFKQWDINVKAIKECADRAAQFGVNLSVQNHHDIAVSTKVMNELLLQVDCKNVFAGWDCWSPHLRGEDISAEAKVMAGKMKISTVADYVVMPRSKYLPDLVNYKEATPPSVLAVPMGSGDLAYKTYFDSLQKNGFEGWVSYEMCSPLRGGGDIKNLESYCKEFINYMKTKGYSNG